MCAVWCVHSTLPAVHPISAAPPNEWVPYHTCGKNPLKHPHRLNDSIAYLVEALSRAARVAGISCGGSVSPSFQMLDGETRACAASAVRVCMGAAVSAAAAAQISGARKCREGYSAAAGMCG